MQANTIASSAAAFGGSLFDVAMHGMPRNGATGRAYRGGNVLALWEVAAEQGYTSNVWLTFNQARDLGGKVRKGSKGVQCCFYGSSADTDGEAQEGEGAAEDKTAGRRAFRGRPFYVFNVAQIDGLPELADLPTDEAEGLCAVDVLIEALERANDQADR